MAAFMQQWGNLSAAGLLAIVAMLVFTGRLVPRSMYKDMEGQRDRMQELWEKANQQLLDEYEAKVEANTEALRAVEQTFNALPRNRTKST